jgi:hypothetical protein
MYPLREVLFLVVCGTIASGDDYDDIVDWGKAHLAFLRGFAALHFGIPWAAAFLRRGIPARREAGNRRALSMRRVNIVYGANCKTPQ